MTADERAQILVTARFLRAAEKIDWLTTGLTLIAAAAIVLTPSRSAAIAALALGIIGKVYSIRIAFDARLFEDIALARLSTEDLDAAFVRLGFVGPEKTGRAWTDRCRGARRLVTLCAIAVAAQALAIILTCVRF